MSVFLRYAEVEGECAAFAPAGDSFHFVVAEPAVEPSPILARPMAMAEDAQGESLPDAEESPTDFGQSIGDLGAFDGLF